MSPADGHGASRATRTLASLCLVLASGWWRSVLPLAASSGLLAIVIGGSVGVGDAIVDNLVRRARTRLGGVLAVVTAERPFREDFATRLAAVPAFLSPVSIEATGTSRRTTTGRLLGIEDPATLGFPGTVPKLDGHTVAVNGPLARELGVAVGDTVVLRTLERSAIPADSPLGRRVTGSRGRRARVAAVLEDGGLGGFSLEPSQSDEPLAVVSLALAQDLTREPGRANAAVAVDRTGDRVGGRGRDAGPEKSREAARRLARAGRPTLRDLGLSLETVRGDLVRLTSESLVLPPEADLAAEAVLTPLGGMPTMLFLANAITVVDGDRSDSPATASVPYSTVAGIGGTELPFGRLLGIDGGLLRPPGPNEIVIDSWLAEDLAKQGRPVRPGSRLALTFFEAETLHGRVIETSRTFTVSGVARMEEAAVERSLVPEVEGITDKRSIAAWDPPFPFDASRVRSTPPADEDDRYWEDHGATPKAFVSMADARAIAAGRFGRTTSWHFRLPEGDSIDEVCRRLESRIDPVAMGFSVRPVLADGLAAARGSTPFAGLFVALSSFVVVAGLSLVWLLSRLLVTSRLAVAGTLAAIGWPPPRLASLFGGIGGLAAAAGCFVGAAIGPAWAAVLLAVLAKGFAGVANAASPTIFQPTTPRFATIAAVAAASFLLAVIAPWLAARRVSRFGVRSLLAGADAAAGSVRRPTRFVAVASSLAIATALAVAATAGPVSQEAGRFFAAGALALVGGCGLVRSWLRPGEVRSGPGLVRRALSLHPERTLAVVGMVALAEFLIVAVSSFAVQPPANPADRQGPAGGWTHMVTLHEPCAADLADQATLESLGLSPDARDDLGRATLLPIRVSRGEDASCLNLQKVGVPTVLGVPRAFRDRGGFRFLASRPRAGGSESDTSPWHLLGHGIGRSGGPIPAVVDEATARYALGLSGAGDRMRLPDERGSEVEIEIVGLLAPGILQGAVIVAEEDFLSLFPSTSGFRLLLAEVPGSPEKVSRTEEALRAAVADFGPKVRSCTERLAALAVVQNTYLAGFQALGTLGLLLGTLGVAAVQARSVLERSGEIGLLTAIGFTPSRLGRLIASEALAMVGLGLALGTLAAAIAVWPQMAAGRASLAVGWALAGGFATILAAVVAGGIVVGRLASVRPAEAIRGPE